ncbi:hypothetical protein NHQ30_009820 [Ciborinia camelliae]|nr:hypothetical protein NHQ30_009820 [Ciborinia camelliae]
MKAEYAASLLYITSLFFAKMSIVMFIDELTPIPNERIATKILGLMISLWAITSVFAAAFQCRPPKVWDNITGDSGCFNQVRIFYIRILAFADFWGRERFGTIAQLLIL